MDHPVPRRAGERNSSPRARLRSMNLDVASLDDAAVVVSDPGAGKRHTYGVTSDRGGLTAVGDADYEFALSARLRLPTPMRSSCINTPQ